MKHGLGKGLLLAFGFLFTTGSGYSAARVLSTPVQTQADIISPVLMPRHRDQGYADKDSTVGQEGVLSVTVNPSAIVYRSGRVLLRSRAKIAHSEGADMLFTVETFDAKGEVIDAQTSSVSRLPRSKATGRGVELDFESTSKALLPGDYCMRLNVATLSDSRQELVKFSTQCFAVDNEMQLTPLETEEYLLRSGNIFHSGADLTWMEDAQ
jgi:hypothetical protein